MRTGRVGQRVMLTRVRLENPGGTALALSGTEIGSDVFCRDASITGGIKLTGAQIRSHLDFDHVRLINPQGSALDAWTLNAGELSLLPAEPIQGVVNLSHAQINVLRDDPSCWPDQLNLDGFTYFALERHSQLETAYAGLPGISTPTSYSPTNNWPPTTTGLGSPLKPDVSGMPENVFNGADVHRSPAHGACCKTSLWPMATSHGGRCYGWYFF